MASMAANLGLLFPSRSEDRYGSGQGGVAVHPGLSYSTAMASTGRPWVRGSYSATDALLQVTVHSCGGRNQFVGARLREKRGAFDVS